MRAQRDAAARGPGQDRLVADFFLGTGVTVVGAGASTLCSGAGGVVRGTLGSGTGVFVVCLSSHQISLA
jgi:hypothetical protein